MTRDDITSENGIIHKLALSIDMVINTLGYAEGDPETGYKPACLIRVCINQMINDLRCINKELGNNWPENK